MHSHPSLSIIGCGKLGKTLGRLWTANHILQLHSILNRSMESAQIASTFIGTGTAIDSYTTLQPSDIYLIATPDDLIEPACKQLAQTNLLSPNSIVFHCSGALPSSILQAAQEQGAAIASVHPIRSFAIPEQVVQDFAGTYCGVEGDQHALDTLKTLFDAIGAQWVPIDAHAKTLYHAAAVFTSNYLVTLLDVAQQTYIEAGIAPDVALKLMAPLMRETAENVFRLGPEAALTGPIARGDMTTAKKQFNALAAVHPNHAALYEQFMKLTVDLVARRDYKRKIVK
jgi:predicted short-subunit dehydrogenase-like oxidoreductase (DUF2520 family)